MNREIDSGKLIELLRASTDPAAISLAEKQLAQWNQVVGFPTELFKIVISNDTPPAIQQFGSVYLKNMIHSRWQHKIPAASLHEEDKTLIRNNIVDAVVQTPAIVKVQLCVCLKTIIKHDFPIPWTGIVQKPYEYLQSQDHNSWLGALLCLYQLIKMYNFQSSDKRKTLIETMKLVFPSMYNVMVTLLPDQSEQSVLTQKQVLKCFYGLIEYTLPLELLTKPVFSSWMEILRQIAERPVPPQTMEVAEDERLNLPWWKCKKWTLQTLYRIFERYGSPLNTQEENIEFAEWYISTFSGGILEVLFKILEQYRAKNYVSPRVLHRTLGYLDECVGHANSWKLLKPHIFVIIQDVLFPLMSFSDSDDELWHNDPHEYIRVKFDTYSDYVSPVAAAQNLLLSCCKKRKDMLQRTLGLCMQVLVDESRQYGPRQRDGAFHIFGTLSVVLLKKPYYQDQIEALLTEYIFSQFRSSLGYCRARACWLLQHYASVNFKNDQFLIQAFGFVVHSVQHDSDLPVRVEAALAMQKMLRYQKRVHSYLEPKVKDVTKQLLQVIRETEHDGLAIVVQRIVPLYTVQLMPMAVDICEHLTTTFRELLECNYDSEEKVITAMGLLNTIETVLSVMEDNPEIMAKLEKTVIGVIGHILHNNIIEYYEEALSLLGSLTSKTISQDMWKILELLYQVFENDGYEYFTDIMPILHNYIIVDTNAFISNENHILAVFNMVKKVFIAKIDEETEYYAAKLLEVLVLQCKDRIDNCLPSFVELVLNRLTHEVKTTELRTMLLQVLIAILYSNPQFFFSIINKLQESVPNTSIAAHFFKQWIDDFDSFTGLHDRKLCVLGLCTLLDMGPSRPNIDNLLPKILPSCLMLFEGLRKAYEARAEYEEEDSSLSSDDEDDMNDEDELSSDEDDIDDTNSQFLRNLARQVTKQSASQGVDLNAKIIEAYDSDDDDDDDDDDDYDAIAIESYTTPLDAKDCPIDEYIQFKDTLSAISTTEPSLFHAMASALNEQQQKALHAIFLLADQRKAQQVSKRIEQSGGYAFTVPTSVPTTFKF